MLPRLCRPAAHGGGGCHLPDSQTPQRVQHSCYRHRGRGQDTQVGGRGAPGRVGWDGIRSLLGPICAPGPPSFTATLRFYSSALLLPPGNAKVGKLAGRNVRRARGCINGCGAGARPHLPACHGHLTALRCRHLGALPLPHCPQLLPAHPGAHLLGRRGRAARAEPDAAGAHLRLLGGGRVRH